METNWGKAALQTKEVGQDYVPCPLSAEGALVKEANIAAYMFSNFHSLVVHPAASSRY